MYAWLFTKSIYTQSHIDYVIEVFEQLIKEKRNLKVLKLPEPEFLRHFTAHFKRVD